MKGIGPERAPGGQLQVQLTPKMEFTALAYPTPEKIERTEGRALEEFVAKLNELQEKGWVHQLLTFPGFVVAGKIVDYVPLPTPGVLKVQGMQLE